MIINYKDAVSPSLPFSPYHSPPKDDKEDND